MKLYKPLITDFESLDHLWKQAEDIFIDRVVGAVGETGVGRVALAGGKTPLTLYRRLADNPVVDWSKIELFQTDERYVPADTKESNQYHIKQAFKDVLEDLREFNVFNTDLPVEMTLKDYSERLESLEGLFFDLTILGIGEDGHVASLFPGGSYLKHQSDTVIATTAPKEFEVARRVSLTIESILNSSQILVILVGEEKQNVLPEMLEGSKSAREFPAKFLLAHPNLTIYQCLDA